MTMAIRIISSMATRQLLAELLDLFHQGSALPVEVESVGGVDAARRVQAGEAFDAVVLAANVIEQLTATGRIVAGSRVDLVRSGVAVAVRAGAPRPDIGSEAAVCAAVLAARSVCYSTGPSGLHLAALFERWGIAGQVQAKLVVPPPGTPVGALIASGEIELGFQQLSELMFLPGIDVVGPLPDEIQITTVFAGAVASASRQPQAARALLEALADPALTAIKRANGMDSA